MSGDGGAPAAHVAALDVLQRMLARLYGVDAVDSVAPFVLDHRTLQELADAGAVEPRPGAREEVFVLDDGQGGVDVALWLDARALEAASDAVAHADALALHVEGFADFCVALEGVSHLLLMAHRVAHGRPVTQLELELQAEVDKYVLARLSPWKHVVALSPEGDEPRVTAAVDAQSVPQPDELEGVLFDGWRPATHLQDEQVERYAAASRYAHRYCRHLERRFFRPRRAEALTREVRAFYRMGQAQRIGHIAGT